jgi:hypothetical protein
MRESTRKEVSFGAMGRSSHGLLKEKKRSSRGTFPSLRTQLKSFEIINMLRKGQIGGIEKGDGMKQATFIANLFGVAL